MKRNKIIGLIVQVALLVILFRLIEFVSSDSSATGVALMTSFLCGILFKYAGDYKKIIE
ncbi:MAG: hypothetical protein RBT65_11115 [Methanolobus sp.]|nr:hypothetical protein [Methanolobus sp.]